jgi:ABC-2 type transport system ATP-binding protein
VEKRDSVIRLTVKNAGSNLQKILRAAGKVEHVDVSSPTLNDVFLHYTGKEIREQEGNSLEFMRTARRAMGH